MLAVRDQLPRIFQANLDRFYRRVIHPGLAVLPIHSGISDAEPATLDEGLDRAAALVDNYTANEAAKAYTLTLAAVFERQLSIWVRAIEAEDPAARLNAKSFEGMLTFCAAHADIDLAMDRIGDDLKQMFVVANVVRHGEGKSCEKLRADAPGLWDAGATDYADLLAGPPNPSESLRMRDHDLLRYVRAATRFWGRADPLPMAVTDPPY